MQKFDSVLFSQRRISVNLVDLVKSFQSLSMSLFQTSIGIYYLFAKIGVDTAENGPLKVCQQLPKSQKNVRINEGPRLQEYAPHQAHYVMTKVETYEQLKLTRTFWRLVRE